MSEASEPRKGRIRKTPAAPMRLEIEDDVAWIHLDDPEKSVNTISTGSFAWFEQQLDEVATQALRGLVVISDKPGIFIAGVDVNELQAISDPGEMEALLHRGHRLVGRFAKLPFPVVAAADPW